MVAVALIVWLLTALAWFAAWHERQERCADEFWAQAFGS